MIAKVVPNPKIESKIHFFYFKTATLDIIFWEFLILYRIVCSPRVKRSVIIGNKYGAYKLPHELPND